MIAGVRGRIARVEASAVVVDLHGFRVRVQTSSRVLAGLGEVGAEVDLLTGRYSIANAGHPSPASYTSGRGRWRVMDSGRGPLLGVVPGVEFPRQEGRLERGDALLIYSDGVIEARDRDLTDGIDRMLGVATMSVLQGGDVPRDVCEAARSGEDDDRGRRTTERERLN